MRDDVMPPNLSQGGRFRYARKTLSRLSQRDVSERTGISKPVLIDIERDRRIPTEYEVVVLADLYGLSPADLLRDRPASKAGQGKSEEGEGGKMLDSCRGMCLFDSALFELVMSSKTVEDLMQVMPQSVMAARPIVVMPISSASVLVSWHEAQLRQDEIDRHVQRLLESSE